jgi:hypothetical protein
MPDRNSLNAEQLRLTEAREGKVEWKKWGPYLSTPIQKYDDVLLRPVSDVI